MSKYILLLLLIPVFVFGQSKYPVNDVVVLRNGSPMQNAWTGGLNNPVFSEVDVNRDGLMDLFVYDKAGWKGMIFINTGSAGHPSFTYAPEYDNMIPPGLRDWAIMRDYNRDGVMDIFGVNGVPGIQVYKGYQLGNGFLGYNQIYSNLTYYVNDSVKPTIWTFPDNMPVIMDINGDGDLDILAPDIAGGISLDYYQNQAVDRGYSNDSLLFTLGSSCQDQEWGQFMENLYNCGISLAPCKKELGPGNTGGISARHQGGACCGFHYRNDKVVSLLLADIACPTTKFLENSGDTSDAIVTRYDTIFPSYDHSVYIPIFPCAYVVDADNDSHDDLFVSPFASNANQEGQSEDVKVVWYYKNQGIDSINKFTYQGDTMLSNGIIDIGTESHAVFFDYNGDGLMDIVVGNYGQFQASGYPKSYLALYKNIGSDSVPKYQEANLNWNNLTTFQLNGIYPTFGDLNGDGKPDMVIGDSYGNISFFSNNGNVNAPFTSMTNSNWFGINVGVNAAPFLYDMNGDSLLDLVIGTRNNNLMYFWNFGTRTTPLFSPDSINTSFGNIRVLDQHVLGTPPGYATPFVTVENGQTVLYSGSQRGFIFKYAVNTDSLRHGTFTLLDSNVLGGKPGLRSTISIADINHDGVNDYLTGNIRGGLNLYSDINWGNVPQISAIKDISADHAQMQVYPNPARDRVICRVSGAEETLVSATLYDMLGATVTAPVSRGADNTLTIALDGITNGIYLIQARDAAGHLYPSKIAIFK